MKSIKILLTAFAALFAVGTLSAQSLNDVKAKYNEAAGLIQAKDFPKAITALEATIEMGFTVGADASDVVGQAQKVLPAAYFQYGLGLCRSGNFEQALPVLATTVDLGELYGDMASVRRAQQLTSQAYLAMGADAFNKKDYKRAVDVFSKGYQANPSDTQLALYLAESYAEDGDYENGFKVYREIIDLESRHSRYKSAADQAREKITYYLTIEASNVAKGGNTTEAYRLLDEILANDPNNAFAHMTKIQTATNAEQWSRVIQWGEAAANAQTDPAQASEAYFLLGAAYQNTENVERAIATYRKVTTGKNVEIAKQQIEILSNPPK